MKSSGSLILIPPAAVYRAVTCARLAAYRHGLLSVSKLGVPVISVGNITTGGTGKTPLVEWVCRTIAEGGVGRGADGDARETKRVCVLTRGYGRANPKAQVVVSDGTKLLADEREAGDEPMLLAENLLGIAAVVSNPHRVTAGEWAIENLNAQVFVLDDAFQHLSVARDMNIATIDATNPWGGGGLLPRGRLREPATGLSRADCIVITRTEQVEDVAPITEAVQHLVGEVPLFLSRMLTSGFRGIHGERVNKADIMAQAVGAFCGVGNPDSFFTHLHREGCQLVFTQKFADHHRYKQSELDALVNEMRARGAESVLTTAKDAIKLRNLSLQIPCYVLEIQIAIDEEERLATMIKEAVGSASSGN